jgi:hypothetical protein
MIVRTLARVREGGMGQNKGIGERERVNGNTLGIERGQWG